ncbi:MAG: hypothetical protein AAF604_02230 [Acidobacteriota bacterium]
MLRTTASLLALLPLLLWGCSPSPPAVGELTVSPAEIRLDYPAHVAVQWQWRMDLEAVPRPMVFVHLRNAAGDLVKTFDHPFPERWQAGDTARYDLPLTQSMLAPPLEAGSYELVAGLFVPAGKRFPLAGGDGRETVIARVEVPAPGATFPTFHFEGPWSPVEAGADRQILAKRWLRREATLEVRGVERAGSLELLVELPTAAQGLTFLGEEREQTVRVSSTCGSEAWLRGAGVHRLSLAVPEDCRFTLTPNYTLLLPEDPEPRSVGLLEVSWGE